MRVLVTGSRNWAWPETVFDELESEYIFSDDTFTVVHGGCPTGADDHASRWAADAISRGLDVVEEIHPADWDRYKKAAGFRRNAEMVKLGADLCLAFILDNSNGATHTAGLAEKAGIQTHKYNRSTRPMSNIRPYKRVTEELKLEGCRLMWRNFAGEKRLYNENGKRQFAIPLEEPLALTLREIGWNVRDNSKKVEEAKLQGNELELLYHLDVTVKMDSKNPPRIFLISKRWDEVEQMEKPSRTLLDEDTVGLLDVARFANVDLILRPYNWEMSGKKGVSAYLKTLFAELEQDELEQKYAHIPIDNEQLAIEAPDDILDGEVLAEWEDDVLDEIEQRDVRQRRALERGAA